MPRRAGVGPPLHRHPRHHPLGIARKLEERLGPEAEHRADQVGREHPRQLIHLADVGVEEPPRRRDPRKVLASMDAASCERDIEVTRIGKSATNDNPLDAEGDGEAKAKELQRDTVLECAVGYFSDGKLAVYRDQVEPLLRAGL